MSRPRPCFAVLIDNVTAEYNAQVRSSIEQAAEQRDIDVLVLAGQRIGAPLAVESAQNVIYSLVTPDVVDGVIIVSSTIGHFCSLDDLAERCHRLAPLPVVSVGIALDGVPSLVVDNASGMELGVGHLVDSHERSRVAFIAGPPESTESEQRLLGYRRALERRGIELDEALVVHGEFTVETGAHAVRELLERRVDFDSIATANDNMALGALDVLQSHGLNVPRDVVVCGFDDISIAHIARPSLSSLRQPIRWLGAEAVASLVKMRAQEPVPPLRTSPTELVRRESCGCGYQLRLSARPNGPEAKTLVEAIELQRGELEERLTESIALGTSIGDWARRLLDALIQELIGVEGRFMAALEFVLDQAAASGTSLDEFQRVISILRAELRGARVADRVGLRQAERLWHTARVVVGAASIRTQGRQRMESEAAAFQLGRSGQRLSTSLNLPLLRKALADELPAMGIHRAAISLYLDPAADRLKSLFVMVNGKESCPPEEPFPAGQLAPRRALQPPTCEHSIVLPLTFDATQLGVAVLAGSATASMYEPLRQQIGSALKSAALHREVVQQVALRERLEQERLREESRVAARIQTSMIPAEPKVSRLDIVGVMVPAAEAGGDYYDVLPTEDGAWLAVGDVAGHGLGAGMIMLMIQSMISSMARLRPEVSPRDVITSLNEALYDNVRHRLQRDEHATLTVMRFRQDGRIIMSGAHEDIIVWRRRLGHCEVLPTPGVWVGAIPNINHVTEEATFWLEPGDILVLYTDGITEARSAHQELYGVERLVALVEQHADRKPQDILKSIMAAVESWCTSFDDDRTLVVARYGESQLARPLRM